jgi:hypothetical protein
LLILLKKIPNFVDHPSVEVFMKLQDLQVLDCYYSPQVILEGPGSGAEESKVGSSTIPTSYSTVVMQLFRPIRQLNNLS